MKANTPASDKSTITDRSKELIARYTCGNVSLQIKRFVTAAEKKARKENILSIRFI